MKTSAKTASNIATALYSRALNALRLSKRIKDLSAVLEDEKIFFRDAADGETLDIDVPGHGHLQVRAPSAGSTKTVTQFNEAKYEQLAASTKQVLTSLGVVTKKTVTTAPSTASVVLTLNK